MVSEAILEIVNMGVTDEHRTFDHHSLHCMTTDGPTLSLLEITSHNTVL